MSTFTKEQLIEHLRSRIEHRKGLIASIHIDRGYRDYLKLELRSSEIALASLEAEPVPFDALRDAVAEVSGGPAMEWSDIYKGHQEVPFINFNSLARIVDKFRTAPPAPVSVPDDIPDSVYEVLCQACGGGGKACDFADELWAACRAAMLQAVPAELQEYRTAAGAAEKCRSCENMQEQQDGCSLMIPEGYVLVPIELTEKMIVEGFESEPDEGFSDPEVWEAYDAMSGCQQAAHRAKLCWAAMIAAALKREVAK